jgi:hypothetical protein
VPVNLVKPSNFIAMQAVFGARLLLHPGDSIVAARYPVARFGRPQGRQQQDR